MRLAIVPARGGSKRIPRKNIIEFHGRPIIYYALNAAKTSGLFEKIHISTDDHEIGDVVKNLGYEIDFFRDPPLADDFTPLLDVVKWVIRQYKRQGTRYDSVTLIYPCSPLLRASDLLRGHEIFNRKNRELPVVSVARFPSPVERAFLGGEDDTICIENQEEVLTRTQDLPDRYYDTGNFAIYSCGALLSSNARFKTRFLKYEMPRSRVVDIDTPEDLEYAKSLFNLL